MPLATLSRILSSKSSVTTRQLPSEDTPSRPIHHTPEKSPKSLRFYSRKQKDGVVNAKRSPAKEPRTFSFSFDPLNVFGSFRARQKLDTATNHSGSRTLYSHSSYLGYEDPEYGEPEAEAEEIRRPSGLGRRASIGDETMDSTDHTSSKHIKYGITPSFEGKDVLPTSQGVDTASVTSRETDLEELVEIRYPSGLGSIKPTTKFFNVDRPLSTYPIFECQALPEAGNISEPSETPVGVPSSCPFVFAKVLPLLASYLPRQTLLALTLVNKAVAEPATRLLWNEITLEVTFNSSGKQAMQILGRKSLTLLDILSTRPELACLIRSLKLHFLFDSPTPSPSPRRRPQPLSLLPYSPPFSNLAKTPNQSTYPHSAPLPLDSDVQSSHDRATNATPSKSMDKDRSSFKLRRASSFFPSGISLNVSLPEVLQISTPKLRRSNVQTHSRSLLKRRSIALTGQSTSQASSRAQNPKATNGDAERPSSSKGFPGDTTWTPPSEWEWTPSTNFQRYSSVPSPGDSLSPSISTSPNTRSNTPTEWNTAPPSSLVERRSRPQPSLPSLRLGMQATGSLLPNLELKTSPSLPSLTALRFPNTPSLMVHSPNEQSSTSPITVPASPITPYSSVSLSAFPLPPSTPPSVPPLPFEYLSSSIQYPESDHKALPSRPVPSPKFNNESFQSLASASANLVQLSHVTLLFISSPPSPGLTSSESFSHMSTDRKKPDESLDIATIQNLRGFLLDLKSLQSLKVMCTSAQAPFHRAQWGELKDMEVEVVCAC